MMTGTGRPKAGPAFPHDEIPHPPDQSMDTRFATEQPRALADRAYLLRAAKAIVVEGDAYGTAAKHSTTIWTRQVIEALIAAVE